MIKKIEMPEMDETYKSAMFAKVLGNKINELVDVVNELQATISKKEKVKLADNSERAFWQELIRTRTALDVAKDKLDTVRQYHRGTAVIRPDDIAAYCDRAIEQITALEQKDVK